VHTEASPQLKPNQRRIAIAGASGAGKTALATRLAAHLEYPRVELDELYYGPGWTIRQEFPENASTALANPTWVTEWQYLDDVPLLAERVDLIIWLDYPRWLTFVSVLLRSTLRRLHHEILWSGNQESSPLAAVWDRHHALRYAASTGGRRLRRELWEAAHRPNPPDIWRFRSPAQLSAWVSEHLHVRLPEGHRR
jgi:adenylate kinase family enzyme